MHRRLIPYSLALPVLLFLPFLAHRELGFDEIATYDAATRQPAALWAMLLHHTDATVGAWYWLERPVVALAGASAGALRLPSLLAAAGTAVVVTVTGTRLAGLRAGLLAGLVLLANPAFWEFADTARPYTLALLTASLCLHQLVRAHGGQLSRRATITYGGLATLTVYLHAMFALFLIGHGVALLVAPSLRASRNRMLLALAAAAVAVMPLAIIARRQAVQTAWIPHTSPGAVFAQVATFFGGDGLLSVAVALVWATLLAAALRWPTPWSRGLVALGVGPPLALATMGVVLHVFTAGYFLYALLPLSIAAGAAAAAASRQRRLRAAVLAPLLLVASAGFVTQARRDYRQEDLRGATAYVAARAHPGDAVLFAPDWTRVPLSYWLDRSHARLRDLAARPVTDETTVPDLYLPERPRPAVQMAALEQSRVWVLGYPGDMWRPTPNPAGDVAAALPADGFHVVARRMFGIVGVTLLERP